MKKMEQRKHNRRFSGRFFLQNIGQSSGTWPDADKYSLCFGGRYPAKNQESLTTEKGGNKYLGATSSS